MTDQPHFPAPGSVQAVPGEVLVPNSERARSLRLTGDALALVPRVTLVFNGPLKMSPGKMAAQAFQAHQRLRIEALTLQIRGQDGGPAQLMREWDVHTTTIARVAKTTAMFERVCFEVPGVEMRDEGFTEVEPDTVTVFATWPALRSEEHKLLSNAKVQLLRDVLEPFAGWPDENVQYVASMLAEHGAPGGPDDTAMIDELRAEALRRHLQLPVAAGEYVQPDNWLV